MALISSDEYIPGFRRLVRAVHGEGGKIVIQLNHAGRKTSSSVTGSAIVGPSALPFPGKMEIPKELTVSEIHEIVEAFGEGAFRVKETGADGVEIHMSHGYLINQFLSPFSNKRSDAYGGTLERRMKMAIEVLSAVRNRVGDHFPILCRISADEYIEGGLRVEEAIEIAKALEANGADALHVSACGATGFFDIPSDVPPYYAEEGVFAHLAQRIKTAVDLPVIAVGRIRTAQVAERILMAGGADLTAMGRALVADPHLPRKVLEGRSEEIIPCISCNRCVQSARRGELRCAVNPQVGREERFRIAKADRPKKIWIIGGGPAGMKAAETASLRGHEVTIFEKNQALGGRFVLASVAPEKQILKEFVDYLKRRLSKLPIVVKLGKPFDPVLLKESRPDIMIVATGAKPYISSIDGIQYTNASSAEEVFAGTARLGQKIVILGGGGIGAEVADFLSEEGKEIILIEERERIALDLIDHLRFYLELRLKSKKVQTLTSAKMIRFEKEGALVQCGDGVTKLLHFDSVIISLGYRSNDALFRSVKEQVSEVYVIGDAREPRELMEAVHEATDLALTI